jgi:hypothetical protein
MTSSTISLLWPAGAARTRRGARGALPESAIADLGLDELARALSLDARSADRLRAVLLALSDDPATIAYRQDALEDVLSNPALADGLAALLPSLNQLGFYGNPARPNEPALQQTLYRLGELELYVDCVQLLRELLQAQGDGLRSPAFRLLRDALIEIEQESTFQELRAELPDMLTKVRNIGSVTIGVNLDQHMLPAEATLLSVNTHRFRGATLPLLGKLSPSETRGLARLHRVTLPNGMPATRENMMLVPLFKDLNEVLESVARPIADALARFARANSQFLVALDGEIGFYLGAARWIRLLLAAGLPMSRPQIAPPEERGFEARALYNPILAMRLLGRDPNADLGHIVVTNDVRFDDDGRIFILTGPNQGGKTTFIQAIGLAHVLAQAGLHVPGQAARLSPADAIYTHFATGEHPELESGRLGEEARRLSEIFGRATRNSLILLNESLSSTSPNESLLLARDVVRGMRVLGTRAIFATHLHGLAAEAGQINAGTAGDSAVASLVSQTEPGDGDAAGRRTFRIVPGPPMGQSYARDIARRHGISYEQIVAAIHGRQQPPH